MTTRVLAVMCAFLFVVGCDDPPPTMGDDGGPTCMADSDCSDGLFCNGEETCDPESTSADARGCVIGSSPCMASETCDEDADMCVASSCANPDRDGDGEASIECGGNDCDDNDALAFPGNAEICDGSHDEDCDPTTIGDRDLDFDGYTSFQCCNGDLCGDDCDDGDDAIHRGQPDICDGKDNDCDGTIDEGGIQYRDLDNDGRGDPSMSMEGGCMTGWVFNADDCDDLRSETYEGAREMCDRRDNDCSDPTDPGGVDPSEDADDDGYSPIGASCVGQGEAGAIGTAFAKTDCDDTMGGVAPGTPEICGDGIDQNCDGIVDNPSQTFCDDADGDGHGNASTLRTEAGCTLPPGVVLQELCDDCNDSQPDAYPGNLEVCDRIDNDCTEGGFEATAEDSDNDGFAATSASCAGLGEAGVPATAFPKTDCDDSESGINPMATELCDGIDSDCSSGGSAADEDADGDGHSPIDATCIGVGEPGGAMASFPKDDCDDSTDTRHPGLSELVCDGIDNDCSEVTSEQGQSCSTGGYCLAGGACGASTAVVQLAAGNNFTCARLGDRTVECWGQNNYGQLGDGTTTDRHTPAPVSGLTDVVDIAAGYNHACARLANGTMRCWGHNTSRQLGDNTTTNRTTPVAVIGMTNVVEMSGSQASTCARRSNGTVECWGANSFGALGDGTTVSRGTPMPVTGIDDAIGLSSYYNHVCVIRQSQTVWCWGLNDYGQLGDGTTTNRTAPVAVSGLTGVAQIEVGWNHTCATTDAGRVHCWGNNFYDQIGDDTGTDRLTPYRVPGVTATQVAAAYDHTCTRAAGGTMTCWGRNHRGQLADGTTTDSPTPQAVPGLTDVVTFASGSLHTCALRRSGTVDCWGYNANGQTGQSSGSFFLTMPTPVAGYEPPSSIVAGGFHTCAVRADDTLSCWGNAGNGQLGNGALDDEYFPVAVTGLTGVDTVELGNSHTCAVMNDDTARCWGFNQYGQVGHGVSGTNESTPQVVSGLTGVQSIAAGQFHTCAVVSGGGVRCWGYGANGRLGTGSSSSANTPQTVMVITNASTVGVGGGHACALLTTGQVRCWGRNYAGQLGDGTTTDRNTPVLVSGVSNATQLSVGNEHNCARISNGTVRCWGRNLFGQLGDGSTTQRETAVAVSGLTNAVEVGAGSDGSCARRSDGTMVCWGRNGVGQLGDGTTSDQTTPNPVPGMTGVVDIDAGHSFNCALLDTGIAYCWGRNFAGGLGIGSTEDQFSPAPIWDL